MECCAITADEGSRPKGNGPAVASCRRERAVGQKQVVIQRGRGQRIGPRVQGREPLRRHDSITGHEQDGGELPMDQALIDALAEGLRDQEASFSDRRPRIAYPVP
jgi:hypothetical protein